MAITLTPIPDIPLVGPGDDLAALIIAACERSALAPADGDVVVVAQKVVSKAEGRYVDLALVQPSARAQELAAQVKKEARLCCCCRATPMRRRQACAIGSPRISAKSSRWSSLTVSAGRGGTARSAW